MYVCTLNTFVPLNRINFRYILINGSLQFGPKIDGSDASLGNLGKCMKTSATERDTNSP